MIERGIDEFVFDNQELLQSGFCSIQNDVFNWCENIVEEIELLGIKLKDDLKSLLFEMIKNSVDAILDVMYSSEDDLVYGKVNLKFFFDHITKRIRFIVMDNGAGNLASSSVEKTQGEYFGGQGYGELSLKQIARKYKRKSFKRGGSVSIVEFIL